MFKIKCLNTSRNTAHYVYPYSLGVFSISRGSSHFKPAQNSVRVQEQLSKTYRRITSAPPVCRSEVCAPPAPHRPTKQKPANPPPATDVNLDKGVSRPLRLFISQPSRGFSKVTQCTRVSRHTEALAHRYGTSLTVSLSCSPADLLCLCPSRCFVPNIRTVVLPPPIEQCPYVSPRVIRLPA
jgi:hypothetical protein